MQRENIKLAVNTKLIVRFEEMNAKECTSRYHDGIEYRYSVTRAENGLAAFLYLPVDGHLAMRRANVTAGDDVELIKTMRMGQAQYGVTILGDATEPPVAQTARMVAPAAPRQALPARPQSSPNGAPYWDQRDHSATPPVSQPMAQPVRQPQVINEVHPLEHIMTRCFVVGGRALWTAYNELRAAGCEYDQPTIEDARAAGISMFIERTRNQQNGGAR